MPQKPVYTIILRGLAFLALLVAAIVMFVSNQKINITITPHESEFIARYTDWNSFTFAVAIDCIGCFYNLSVLILPPGSLLWRFIMVCDVILTMLLGTSIAAGWQTYALIKCGDPHLGWLPICTMVPEFCNKIIGSLVATSIACFMSLVLLLCSFHVSLNPFMLDSS